MINFTSFSSRFHDEYFLDICNLFKEELEHKNIDASIYYYGVFHTLNEQTELNTLPFDKDPAKLHVLVITDYLIDGINLGFDLSVLSQFNKTFLIASTTFLTETEIALPNNVHMIHIGPEWCYGMNSYRNLPLQQKTDQGPHWICLNKTVRPHRILVESYLSGIELGLKSTVGMLKAFIPEDVTDLDSYLNHHGFNESIPKKFLDDIKRGWARLQNGLHYVTKTTDMNVNFNYTLDNAANYSSYLNEYYKSTVVEISTESIFFTRSIFATKKILNSIYGLNFPIIISSPGIVNYLSNHGFDVFDDIIAHSYDQEKNHTVRLFKAIDYNVDLLDDEKYARSIYKQHESRLLQNLMYAKNEMYDHFKLYALTQFRNFLKS